MRLVNKWFFFNLGNFSYPLILLIGFQEQKYISSEANKGIKAPRKIFKWNWFLWILVETRVSFQIEWDIIRLNIEMQSFRGLKDSLFPCLINFHFMFYSPCKTWRCFTFGSSYFTFHTQETTWNSSKMM